MGNKKIFIFYFSVVFILTGAVPIFSVKAALCDDLSAATDADAADGLTNCSFSGDTDAAGVFSEYSLNLPTEGSTFAVLSTGDVDDIKLLGSSQPGCGSDGYCISTDLAAAAASDDGNDATFLTLNFTVPASANCLSFDFEFLTEEYSQWVTSKYNDYFYACFAGNCNDTNTIAYDDDGNIITVNNNFFDGSLIPPNAFGDAGNEGGQTKRLTTTAIVTPESNITLTFEVGDIGDSVWDSAVFLDNLRIRYREPGMCTPGTVYCTDVDDDGYYVEGGECGEVDCDDNDWCVNPGALEEMTPGLCDPLEYDLYVEHGCEVQQYTYSCGDVCIYGCSDGKDNDCDGLVDSQDDGCPQFLPGGLVPCGRKWDDPNTEEWENCPCRPCHFLVLSDKIIDFALVYLVIPLAVLLIVVGGVMLLTAAGSPEKVSRGKTILKVTIVSLLIIFAAWLIVNTILMLIGVADWTGLETGWWQIDCPVPGVCNDEFHTCKLPGE